MQFVIGAIKEMVEPRGIGAIASRQREALAQALGRNA